MHNTDVCQSPNGWNSKYNFVVDIFTSIKGIIVFASVAMVLPWLSLHVLPIEVDLIGNLYRHIGPTMPFLIFFSCYTIAGLWLVTFKVTNRDEATDVLNHTEKISGWIVPIGIIGTYHALIEVLAPKNIDFSFHIMHALYSTLIAMIIYVVVGITSEFIKKVRNYPSQDAEDKGNFHKASSDNYLILKQIEVTGCVIGICAFIYYLITKAVLLSS